MKLFYNFLKTTFHFLHLHPTQPIALRPPHPQQILLSFFHSFRVSKQESTSDLLQLFNIWYLHMH